MNRPGKSTLFIQEVIPGVSYNWDHVIADTPEFEIKCLRSQKTTESTTAGRFRSTVIFVLRNRTSSSITKLEIKGGFPYVSIHVKIESIAALQKIEKGGQAIDAWNISNLDNTPLPRVMHFMISFQYKDGKQAAQKFSILIDINIFNVVEQKSPREKMREKMASMKGRRTGRTEKEAPIVDQGIVDASEGQQQMMDQSQPQQGVCELFREVLRFAEVNRSIQEFLNNRQETNSLDIPAGVKRETADSIAKHLAENESPLFIRIWQSLCPYFRQHPDLPANV